jgi:hypothetical protein
MPSPTAQANIKTDDLSGPRHRPAVWIGERTKFEMLATILLPNPSHGVNVMDHRAESFKENNTAQNRP